MAKELLTPIQVAQAMEVSESSVKRWCDKGIIPTTYTAGGHRRIPVAGLLAFLRARNLKVANPAALGLPPLRGDSPKTPDHLVAPFTEGLLRGDHASCRLLILELYLAEYDLSALGDRILAPALHQIGERWGCHEAEVYQERHACGICLRILHELSTLIVEPPGNAPLALGGTPAGDQYQVTTAMVELVLRDAQWRAISLGHNLPLGSLEAAVQRHRPRMVWLSVSHVEDREQFLRDYDALYERFGEEVLFVVGGRELVHDLRQRMRFAVYCENFKQLAELAATLHRQSDAKPR